MRYSNLITGISGITLNQGCIKKDGNRLGAKKRELYSYLRPGIRGYRANCIVVDECLSNPLLQPLLGFDLPRRLIELGIDSPLIQNQIPIIAVKGS